MRWPWEKKAPPLCINCRWFVKPEPESNLAGLSGCAHGLVCCLIDGAPVPANVVRMPYIGECGPSGKLFEAKEGK